MKEYIVWLNSTGMDDVEHVGGKNASLGEMISNLASVGVDVPGGFATTATAFREFLSQSGIDDRINAKLGALDVDDVNALAAAGKEIRQWVIETPFQPALTKAIESAYEKMQADAKSEFSVAVRSSATAEDLPDASFPIKPTCGILNPLIIHKVIIYFM